MGTSKCRLSLVWRRWPPARPGARDQTPQNSRSHQCGTRSGQGGGCNICCYQGCTEGFPGHAPSPGEGPGPLGTLETAAARPCGTPHAPCLEQGEPLGTAPARGWRSSAQRALAPSLPAARLGHGRQGCPSPPTPRPPTSPCAAPHPTAAQLGCIQAGEPCADSVPAAPGAGNGYWFSGLQPFPFTC